MDMILEKFRYFCNEMQQVAELNGSFLAYFPHLFSE